MWPFGRDPRDRALDVALAQITDLKTQIRDLMEERRSLLDRIMALTNPGALREVNRAFPRESQEAPAGNKHREQPPQGHRFPGNEVMVLPTRRPEPPAPFPPEPSELSSPGAASAASGAEK